MKFLLSLMRIGHMIMGITPPPPEEERFYLLTWIVSLLLVVLLTIGVVLFLVPRVIH